MADAVTSHTIIDSKRNVVMAFTNISDGTGESAVLKVDVSALAGAPTGVSIDKVEYDCNGMAVEILWDADTDVVGLICASGNGCFDFTSIGGLKNNSGTGKTGDIKFTTLGHSANDTYTVVLYMHKNA